MQDAMTNPTHDARIRSVLNAGAGPRSPHSLHPCFAPEAWREVRLDIDPATGPDVVGTVIDMHPLFDDGAFDAIWSSHSLEHLYGHEVLLALDEFRRVLRPDGFAVVTCPDIEAVAQALVDNGIDWQAYEAPVGPVRVHDMLFGHGGSIAAGNTFMAHRTGFTQQRLGTLATQAGFGEVRVGRGNSYDLWAILGMPDCDREDLFATVGGSNLGFLFPDRNPGPDA